MPHTNLLPPLTDPTPIFEAFRGSYATELLTAAVAHFEVCGKLKGAGRTISQLQSELGLQSRPFTVLLTALKSFGLVVQQGEMLMLTPLASEHLAPGSSGDVTGYIGLAAESPGVLEMVERLRTNCPAHAAADEGGAAFIYREGIDSAMEQEASARRLTLALAGRAKNVAPVLAEQMPVGDSKCVLDIAGGTGIYSVALLRKNPDLTAIVFDRPEVLKIAREFASQYGVADRLECRAGDMFADPLPRDCSIILLSNVLHDWDVRECQTLLRRCADSLSPGGQVWIHDVFLNDALDGPLPIALYSAALFTLTEGRAYSAAEYRGMLHATGFDAAAEIVPTLIHCGVLTATKR